MKQVNVLVDCVGIDGVLSYRVPDQLTVKIGDILTVPLGTRSVGAIAVELIDLPLDSLDSLNSEYELKEVQSVVNTGLFPSGYWQLLNLTASYYRTSLIQTAKVALPPNLLDRSSYRIKVNQNIDPQPEKLTVAAQVVWDFLHEHPKPLTRRYITQKLPKYAASGLRSLMSLGYIATELEPPRKPQPKFENVVVLIKLDTEEISSRHKEILHTLAQAGGELSQPELITKAKTTGATLKTLVQKGLIAITPRECLRLGGKTHFVQSDRPKALTPDQTQALTSIQSLFNQSATMLLHGVTGSGKTEVYLQAIALVLAMGKSALVLVPEIGLTPQLTDRFRARFGDLKVNLYHSRLSDGERFDTWRQMLDGSSQILIGTRSAVFAPLHNLGIIILDEEHDPSFKQDQPQPCYHARTVAEWRSQLAECPLVLGSATPSAEVLHAIASQPDVQYLALPERIGNKQMPKIQIVDMRSELQSGNWSIFSRDLQAAIAEMQTQKKQGILFIHRRGYSTFVSCRNCGYVSNCPRCDVSLSYHHEAHDHNMLRCHYCNYSEGKASKCPSCDSPYFKHFGSGTQKVEQELAKLFPELKILRFDSDTTRNKDQHRHLLEKFQAGDADLLVGTQMLTKGIDIPQVTLVGVISADGLLNFSDYRAGERAFQILTQVAGRAGRGTEVGEVIIQTYTPEHPVIEAVKNYDGDAFMRSELETRTALNYPPVGQMALIRLNSENSDLVESVAIALSEDLRTRSELWEVLGAAPATITRVNNRYRWQILLKFHPQNLNHIPTLDDLKAWINSSEVRVAIDIDPLTIL
ncbi:replication restart DNA helicase PriA [Synechococcus sp. PCC 7502]|uniref:primosomal protein N' n=1 Tax=Synechococcus sp. PCC 7502 TaxID=1173263 RepID=UPI00029F8ED6|nr:primosomal protein N' [Synechococcus sp. PCC 7502]AFY75263.1 replication restart DNA helicase PriA [Synechococcus sp. PCC 7502]